MIRAFKQNICMFECANSIMSFEVPNFNYTIQSPREKNTFLLPPQSGETVQTNKYELSAIKAGLRKVKIFTEYVSNRRVKKGELEGSERRCFARSDDGEYNYPFDSDSLDNFEEGESDELKDDSTISKSFSYGTLAYANCGGRSFYSNMRKSGEDEDWI
ncbi:hypothetical protein K2173_026935 [Erythroxylum novogranatense]|uniref:Uncharacterized protein n=1 Tax=Erythroxylum novogranatense TaxID=1862640 RepID=A0AAV8U060_9ROSI|nr:hypothetical protein K2173_026935 [Erythroxylum novogranatense]